MPQSFENQRMVRYYHIGTALYGFIHDIFRNIQTHKDGVNLFWRTADLKT